jgi:hypothetical protein
MTDGTPKQPIGGRISDAAAFADGNHGEFGEFVLRTRSAKSKCGSALRLHETAQ